MKKLLNQNRRSEVSFTEPPPELINEPFTTRYSPEPGIQPLRRPIEELYHGQDLYEVHDIFMNHPVLGPLVEIADSELQSDLYTYGSVRSNLFVGDGVRFKTISPAIVPDYDRIKRDFGLPPEFVITEEFLTEKMREGYVWGIRLDLEQLDLAEVRVYLGLREDEEVTEAMLQDLNIRDIAYISSMRVFDHSTVNDFDACVVASPTQFEDYVKKLDSRFKDKNIKVSHLKPPLTSREHVRVEIDESEFNVYRIGDPKDVDKDLKDLSRSEKASLIDQFSKNILIQNDRVMVKISPHSSVIHDPFKVLGRIKYTDRLRLRNRPLIHKFASAFPDYEETVRKSTQGVAFEPLNRTAEIELNKESEKFGLLSKIKSLVDLDREPTEQELDEVRGWELFELLQQTYRLYRKEAANEVLPPIRAEEALEQNYRIGNLNNSWVYDIHRFLERYMDPKYNLFPDEIGTMTQEEIIELFNRNATINCSQALARAYKQTYPRDEWSNQLTENPYTAAINKIPIMRYLFPALFDRLLPGVEGIPMNLLTHNPEESPHLLNHLLKVNEVTLSETDSLFVANRLRLLNWFFEYVTDNVHDPLYIEEEALDINNINEYLAVVVSASMIADSMITISNMNHGSNIGPSSRITYNPDEITSLIEQNRWVNADSGSPPVKKLKTTFGSTLLPRDAAAIGINSAHVFMSELSFPTVVYNLRYPGKLVEGVEYRLSITQPIV